MKVTQIIPKEIRIRELRETTIEELAKSEAASGNAQIFWCNGFMYSCVEFDEKLRDKILDGIWYIYYFIYAKCPEKVSKTKWNGNEIEVIDQTGFKWIEELTNCILKKEIS